MNRCQLLLLGLVGALLIGCGSSTVSNPVQTPADASAKQIQALDKNPNMPEEQKAALRARLEQQKKAGEAFASTKK